MNIMDPEEFRDKDNALALFHHNEPIVAAQNLVSRIPPDGGKALTQLEFAASSAPWIKDHPEYPLAVKALERMGEADDPTQEAEIIVQAQRYLSNLNLLGHVFTRTRKRDVLAARVVRKAKSHKVIFSDLEKRFYRAVTNFVRAESASRTNLPLIQQWMLNTPQRRMASSIPAMVEFYRLKVGVGSWELSEDEGFWEDDSFVPQGEQSLEGTRKKLQDVISQWRDDSVDTKYQNFLEIIKSSRTQRGKAKVLVFAFFKDTLYYLANQLMKDGIRASVISGDVKASARPGIIENFKNDPEVEVLLSSRVGSEGLDFQFCSTLVNYDLPWNPMDIEQRIGRLDRLGQESPVIDIHNLCAEGTIEQRILECLFDRIGIFEKSIGDIEAILGDEWKSLEKDLLSTALTAEEEEARIERSYRVFADRMKDLEVLESESARFIGTDLYFEKEVNKIRDRFRYVTSKQLHDYILEFISRHCPRTRFVYNPIIHTGTIVPDSALQRTISESGEGLALRAFLGARETGIKFTMNSEVAFDAPQLEFINVTHPLIQVITEYYQKSKSTFSKSHHVALANNELPEGMYLYFIWKLKINAAQTYNSMELVVLDDRMEEVAIQGGAERLLGLILEKGTEPENRDVVLEAEAARIAHERAHRALLTRAAVIRKEIEFTNEAYVERRLRSIGKHFEKMISSLQVQLREGMASEKHDGYIRMVEGKLKKAEGSFHAKKTSVEKDRIVSEEINELASGLLESVALGRRND